MQYLNSFVFLIVYLFVRYYGNPKMLRNIIMHVLVSKEEKKNHHGLKQSCF